jgi:hypothetical protein
MANSIVKVEPRYMRIGQLPGKLSGKNGNYKLHPTGEKVPLGTVVYYLLGAPSGIETSFSWERIRKTGKITVSPDSVVELNLHFLVANIQSHGALLLRKEQVTPNVFSDVLSKLQKLEQGKGINSDIDLGLYSWLVFLPYLTKDGNPAFGFDLTRTGASPSELASFISDLTPEVANMFRQSPGSVLWVNPYYNPGAS